MTQAEPLRAEERYLLSLLVRDTSTVTVAYLPHRFAFGIKPRFTQQHLILVKDRKKPISWSTVPTGYLYPIRLIRYPD
jgi:hypothetical protein